MEESLFKYWLRVVSIWFNIQWCLLIDLRIIKERSQETLFWGGQWVGGYQNLPMTDRQTKHDEKRLTRIRDLSGECLNTLGTTIILWYPNLGYRQVPSGNQFFSISHTNPIRESMSTVHSFIGGVPGYPRKAMVPPSQAVSVAVGRVRLAERHR